MKTHFLLFTLFILPIPGLYGQNGPTAKLIDQFGPLNCEDVSARSDGFISLVAGRPDSTGYMIIYGEKNRLFANLVPEQFLLTAMYWKKIDRKRVVVLRGEEGDYLGVEFWLVPGGAEKPKFKEASWDLTLTPGRKPFLFDSNVERQDEFCRTPYLRLELFSEFLNANPRARGNVVIGAASAKERKTEKTRIAGELAANGVALKRIRFFESRDEQPAGVQLWLLP